MVDALDAMQRSLAWLGWLELQRGENWHGRTDGEGKGGKSQELGEGGDGKSGRDGLIGQEATT